MKYKFLSFCIFMMISNTCFSQEMTINQLVKVKYMNYAEIDVLFDKKGYDYNDYSRDVKVYTKKNLANISYIFIVRQSQLSFATTAKNLYFNLIKEAENLGYKYESKDDNGFMLYRKKNMVEYIEFGRKTTEEGLTYFINYQFFDKKIN